MSWNSSQDTNHTLNPIIYHLQLIKENVLIYVPLLLIIFGTIGFIGNVFTFLQPSLRFNTCCIYLLCGSIADVINLFVNLLSLFADASTSNIISLITNSHRCKLKLFGLVFLPQLSINFLILSVIDRYACTCPMTSSIRHVRRLGEVPWIVCLTLMVTSVMSLYSPMSYDALPGLGCTCINPFANSVSYITIHGFLTPSVMLSFAILTYRNVLQSRRRANLTNIDRSRNPFIRMIFTQVFTTSFLTLQWIGFYMYHIFVMYKLNSREQRILHYFIWYISNNTYYLINVKSFYLSTLTSGVFRKTFMESLLHSKPRCQPRQESSRVLEKFGISSKIKSKNNIIS